jgi:hypothetical protein
MNTRILLSVCVTGLMASAPLTARASVGTCAQALLEAPAGDLQWTLQVTPEQASQLWAVRYHSSRRLATIQGQLDLVRAKLARHHALAPRQLRHLRQQEASLVQQLQWEQDRARSRILSLLTPWQRNRCVHPVVIHRAPPRVVTVRHPAPRRAKPVPPRVVHRAPARAVRRAPAPRAVHRAPAPRVVHRAPAARAVQVKKQAPRRSSPSKGKQRPSTPSKGRRNHR